MDEGTRPRRGPELRLRLAAAICFAAALVALGWVDAAARSSATLAGDPFRRPPAEAYLVALVVLAIAVPRRRLDPLRRAALAGGSIAFVAAWFALALHGERRDAELQPLSGTIRDADGERRVAATVRQLRGWHRLSQAVGGQGSYALRLAGTLVTPDAGRYGLALECRGRCAVSVSGHQLLASWSRPAVEIALTAGVQPLQIQLDGDRPYLRLSWTRPGLLHLVPLDQAVGADLTLEGFQRRERAAFWRLAGMAVLWAASAAAALRLLAALAGWRSSLLAALRARWAEPVMRRALVAAVLAALSVSALRVVASANSPDGLHVHAWTGEYLMQTVSAADLRIEPFRSLFYLHIQPPLLDALRAASVWRHSAREGLELLDAVDLDVYRAWAIAAGLLAALVYAWLHQLAGRRIAAAGTGLFLLHPAFLFYATFLDSTFVSGAGITWISYEVWRFRRGRGSPVRLATAMSLLFLTRSIVQWPFIVVASASLWLLCVKPRTILRAVGPFALVVAIYTVKQYALFGVTMTSTFGPLNFCEGLSVHCHGSTPVELPDLPPPAAASVLRRTEKLNGEYNWNQLAFLKRSFSQMEEYKQLLASLPPTTLFRRFGHTLTHWLRPSSRHSPHVLVDAIPWREGYDAVMSGAPLVLLLFAGSAFALFGPGTSWRSRRYALGLALPALYVMLVTNMFESGENMRYKFIVETVLWIFFWTQGVAALKALRRSPAVSHPAGAA